jgi:hypothetical protein
MWPSQRGSIRKRPVSGRRLSLRGRVDRSFARASQDRRKSHSKTGPGSSRIYTERSGVRNLTAASRIPSSTAGLENKKEHRHGSPPLRMSPSPSSPSQPPSPCPSSPSLSMDTGSLCQNAPVLPQTPASSSAEDEGEDAQGDMHGENDSSREGVINTDSSDDEGGEAGGSRGERGDSEGFSSEVRGLWARQTATLDCLVAEQSEILGERNRPDTWSRRGLARPMMLVDNLDRSEIGGVEGCEDNYDEEERREMAPTSPVSRWGRYLRMLPKDFFSSAEARMQKAGASTATASLAENEGLGNGSASLLDGTRRRCASYAGLALCHAPENCPDLLYVYDQVYEIKIRRGGRKEGYQQFRGVVGQLARFAVAVDVVPSESFAVEGGLFELATSSKLVRAFIGGFQTNAQASTVYAKATLLGLLCRMAKLHFAKISAVETPAVLSRIEETMNLLGSFRRVEKATSRRQTAVQRDQEHRETFIHTADWYKLQRRIEQDMASVCTGVCSLFQRFGEESHTYMDENHSLVRKYSLLMVVYILLTGGGQRPQAYASLQHPRESVLRRWELEDEEMGEQEAEQSGDARETVGEWRTGRTVKLYPLQEKTPRGSFCPGILFPEKARSFFVTYARMIRPAIMRGAGKVSSDALHRERTFLLHTETGNALSGENLRNTLRFYIGGIGGLSEDLSRVTVMTVRASYASVMFQAFRRGKFPGLTAEQFLGDLAETMNTSTEMLRTTYIATNGSEFDEAAGAFLRASREE